MNESCIIEALHYSDEIWFHPTCNETYSIDCHMYFGNMLVSDSQFHLEDEELDRVTLFGNMTIGDRKNSTEIDGIYFSGINYISAHNGLLVNAHSPNVTVIHFLFLNKAESFH